MRVRVELVIAACLFAGACTAASPSTHGGARASAPPSTASAASPAHHDVYIATADKPHHAFLTALAVGRLVQRKGCVVLAGQNGKAAMVIWPFRYRVVRGGGGRLLIVNAHGRVVAKVGERVKLVGGWGKPSLVKKRTALPIPDRCPAHGYFATGGPA
jgi:hypothetical protein